ncbi:hypothetical protein HOY82DRAFT_569406 [Tuber indicum]|nr:hypothetical protein HOY82DRAFT_569406 [Tuber indicum]
MFPPGLGNVGLNVGYKFVISLFGTNEVLTAEGEEVCLREYKEGNEGQAWLCEMNSENRFGMRNAATGRLLGRRGFWGEQFGCSATNHLRWEWLTFTRLSLGGYSLMVSSPAVGDLLSPIQRVGSSSANLRIGAEGDRFGLHQLTASVFRRFEWIVPGRLARSSAPYYDDQDSDQSINETSTEFLLSHGIKNIISLNSIEISPRERDRLCTAGISYSHIKAPECTAPTQVQFYQIWNAYNKGGATIVYCGYGDGRTGMAISAIQLFQHRTLTGNDYRANGVQCSSQLAALNVLRERIHSDETSDDLLGTPDNQPPPYTETGK